MKISNFDNIKPYSDMCHECAMAGGSKSYAWNHHYEIENITKNS